MSLDLTPVVVATHLSWLVAAKGASESIPSAPPLPDDNDDGEDRHLHRSTLLFAIISPLINSKRGERQ